MWETESFKGIKKIHGGSIIPRSESRKNTGRFWNWHNGCQRSNRKKVEAKGVIVCVGEHHTEGLELPEEAGILELAGKAFVK